MTDGTASSDRLLIGQRVRVTVDNGGYKFNGTITKAESHERPGEEVIADYYVTPDDPGLFIMAMLPILRTQLEPIDG